MQPKNTAVFRSVSLIAVLAFFTGSMSAAGRQQLHSPLPKEARDSRFVAQLPKEQILKLGIGLPLRNQDELEALLGQLYDSGNDQYHAYLTPEQFTARFGPSEEDYRAVVDFAQLQGLVVTATYSNRMLVNVTGTVEQIEKTFHVNMQTRFHTARGSFYAANTGPSVDLDTQILDITGLDNFALPRPMDLKSTPLSQEQPLVTGSGPGGLFIGKDFRAAYAPLVKLTGAGQTLGLFELDGFYAADVAANFKQAGLPAVSVDTVLVNGFSGAPGGGNIEVTLDIMMAAYMAPGLSKVMVYEGSNWNDVLNRMATDNLAQQLSSSWCFSPINATTEQIFKQFMAQGQSFFQASGDSGAYHGWIFPPADNPNLTVVGGTSLSTSGLSGPWQAETAWSGSGGGISTTYPIPSYQKNVNMAASGGSVTMRNIPDVALTADVQLFLIQGNGHAVSVGGTSAAAPLWAGFAALVNQQAAASKKPPMGFLNPMLYSIGMGTNYTADFHDIAIGNTGFAAVSGYDLATGWGTPTGQHLIDDLTGMAGQPGFTLSAAPGSVSVRQSSTASIAVAVSALNGFKSAVDLSVSGLPVGVTGSFSAPTAAGVNTLTLSASASAQAGTSAIGITGISGTLKNTALVTLTVLAPNFTVSSAAGTLVLQPGATATTAVTLSPQNGFTGTVSLAVSSLPSGVTAAWTPLSSAGVSTLTLSAASSAVAGMSNASITAVSGSLIHTLPVTVTVVVPPANSTLVNFGSLANVGAIVVDGSTFTSGVDGKGAAYSANLLGPTQTLTGTLLTFGSSNVLNAISSKTVPLPAGAFATLKFAAAAMNGNLPLQSFLVTYVDGTTTTFAQGVSDWFTPQKYSGETKLATLLYRDNSNGTRDGRLFYLYGYSFTLNAAKKVSSITLPNNRNVVVLAISLIGNVPLATASTVDLSAAFDVAGISKDGHTFLGGLDGVGFAYSGNLLGTSQVIGGITFNFGPADAPDAVTGNGKAVVLPTGSFSRLLMLGTAVNGPQTGQTFKVNYADGSSATFVQAMSDWFVPRPTSGETQGVVMQSRNAATGTPDHGPFYVYEYSFSLNPAKTVSSVTLPLNQNVRILALTFTP